MAILCFIFLINNRIIHKDALCNNRFIFMSDMVLYVVNIICMLKLSSNLKISVLLQICVLHYNFI